MATELLIFGYVATLLAVLAGLSLYDEQRRRRFEPPSSRDRVFRCKQCGFVYTDDPDVDLSRCPQCGRSNEAFKF